MLEIIQGIVVKTFASGLSKVCLLTGEHGKISLTVFNRATAARMRLGSTVEAVAKRDAYGLYNAQAVDLLAQPSVVHTQLAWLHHALEVVYFFSPALQPASTLFLVLQRGVALFDMQKDINVDWSLLNRAVIGCLLMQFGFYPPAPYEKALARIEGLLSMTVDFMQSQNLELLTSLAATLALHDLAEYDAWLLASISTHPRIGGFKTLPFVYKTMQRGYLGHKS